METRPFTAITEEQWAAFKPLFDQAPKGPGRPRIEPRFLVNAYIHFWLAQKWVEVPGGAPKSTANRSYNKHKELSPTLLDEIRLVAKTLGILG